MKTMVILSITNEELDTELLSFSDIRHAMEYIGVNEKVLISLNNCPPKKGFTGGNEDNIIQYKIHTLYLDLDIKATLVNL